MFEDFEPKLEVMFSSLSVNLSRPSKCGLDGEWEGWERDRSLNPLFEPVDMLLFSWFFSRILTGRPDWSYSLNF